MPSPGNYLKKVSPGETLESIPRDMYNEMVDAVLERRNAGQTGAGQPSFGRDATTVTVRNDSGGDVGRWGVLALGTALVPPADNRPEFERGVLVGGLTPSADGKAVCVTLSPLADGAVGRAVVLGVVPVYLDVVGESDPFAYPVTGQTGFMRTGKYGPARLIYKEPDEDEEGLRQGYVLLHNASPPGPWARCERRVIDTYCLDDQLYNVVVFDYINAFDQILYTVDEPCKVGVTFSGVTDGTCTGCNEQINGDLELTRTSDTAWGSSGGAVCGADVLGLSLALSGGTLTLTIKSGTTTIAVYSNASAGGYDGSGSTVLTKISSTGACLNWPSTVTVHAA